MRAATRAFPADGSSLFSLAPVAAALALLLFGAPASAEPLGRHFEFTQFGGYTVFDTDRNTVTGTPLANGLYLGGRLGYQWERCNPNGRLCAPIPGATASTYTVDASDPGHALVVVVQALANGVGQPSLSTAALASA